MIALSGPRSAIVEDPGGGGRRTVVRLERICVFLLEEEFMSHPTGFYGSDPSFCCRKLTQSGTWASVRLCRMMAPSYPLARNKAR